MMIDVTYMRNVGAEVLDHRPDSAPGIPRIDGMRGAPCLLPEGGLALEFNVRNEMMVVRSGRATRVGHGEQSHLVALGAQQFHQFEEVNFGAAERVVIFVAE